MPALRLHPAPNASSRLAWAVGIGYVVVFLLLDWVSYIRPLQGLNITPWNPQPALAISLLLWNRRALGWVWLGLLAAELVVRGMPADWRVTLAAAAGLCLSYAAIAGAIAARLGGSPSLATRRDLLWLGLITAGGALLSGAVYVGIHAAAGLAPTGSLLGAIARYWVGDAVGVVVMLPMLLVLMDPQRRATLGATLQARPWWCLAGLIALLLFVVFWRGDRDHVRYFYVLLLPVVWAAARLGLIGAVLAAGLTQAGLIVAVQLAQQPDLTVFELQAVMAALTMTGLMLGVAVDERERAQVELQRSLRLAAAGQMAAALAHELSQPLTALGTYAQATRLILSSPDLAEAQRLDRLAEVTQRMAQDAQRASEVVKRLRDFFRSGSTQLQPVAPAALLAEALAAQQRRADALGIQVDREIDPGCGPLLLDPVQMAVVLRNLIANALDAAAAAPPPGRIALRAREVGSELLIEVSDSGPGVDRARLAQLFDPGPSDKPGGMGVGLSICRAIVDAHGGSLWAEAGPSGCFRLTLPIDSRSPAGASHAP